MAFLSQTGDHWDINAAGVDAYYWWRWFEEIFDFFGWSDLWMAGLMRSPLEYRIDGPVLLSLDTILGGLNITPAGIVASDLPGALWTFQQWRCLQYALAKGVKLPENPSQVWDASTQSLVDAVWNSYEFEMEGDFLYGESEPWDVRHELWRWKGYVALDQQHEQPWNDWCQCAGPLPLYGIVAVWLNYPWVYQFKFHTIQRWDDNPYECGLPPRRIANGVNRWKVDGIIGAINMPPLIVPQWPENAPNMSPPFGPWSAVQMVPHTVRQPVLKAGEHAVLKTTVQVPSVNGVSLGPMLDHVLMHAIKASTGDIGLTPVSDAQVTMTPDEAYDEIQREADAGEGLA